ncbi:hypothetical protein [uncultured Nostoc sp.]|uniref:hypothetical protein n=1 Tax=uncultured Nostoc sp. TaxID=340711 RepID=UPI0035CA546A
MTLLLTLLLPKIEIWALLNLNPNPDDSLRLRILIVVAAQPLGAAFLASGWKRDLKRLLA